MLDKLFRRTAPPTPAEEKHDGGCFVCALMIFRLEDVEFQLHIAHGFVDLCIGVFYPSLSVRTLTLLGLELPGGNQENNE